jgi:hypothetical protein
LFSAIKIESLQQDGLTQPPKGSFTQIQNKDWLREEKKLPSHLFEILCTLLFQIIPLDEIYETKSIIVVRKIKLQSHVRQGLFSDSSQVRYFLDGFPDGIRDFDFSSHPVCGI